MIIGTFTKQGKEFHGQIKTLRLAAELKLTPVEKSSAKSPDYRVVRDTIEIGAGWMKKTKDDKRPFVSILLDDPSFAAPLNCALFANEDEGYNLVWNR